MPRSAALGEHVDDHQQRFARWMSERGRLTVATEQAALLPRPGHGHRDTFRRTGADADRTQVAERFRHLVEGLLDDLRPRMGRWPQCGPLGSNPQVYLPWDAWNSTRMQRADDHRRVRGRLRTQRQHVGGPRPWGVVPGTVAIGELVHLVQRGLIEHEACGCGQPLTECPFCRFRRRPRPWARTGRRTPRPCAGCRPGWTAIVSCPAWWCRHWHRRTGPTSRSGPPRWAACTRRWRNRRRVGGGGLVRARQHRVPAAPRARHPCPRGAPGS